MKDNITYYRHEVDSHRNRKFKALRQKYGWSGEGRFWALNNCIAVEEGCVLDLNKKFVLTDIADELGFSVEELTEFIDFLHRECELIQITDGKITTKDVQEVYQNVSKKRQRNKQDYERKKAQQEGLSEVDQIADRLKKSEKTVATFDLTPEVDKATKKVMQMFGLNEMNHYRQMVDIGKFFIVMNKAGKLAFVLKQIAFYWKYKKAADEKMHSNYKSFLGNPEDAYTNGAWATTNWEDLYKRKFEGKNVSRATKEYVPIDERD